MANNTEQQIKSCIERISDNTQVPFPYYWEENAGFMVHDKFTFTIAGLMECNNSILSIKSEKTLNLRNTQFEKQDGNPIDILLKVLAVEDDNTKCYALLHGDPRYPGGGLHTQENRGCSHKCGNEEGFFIRSNLYSSLWKSAYRTLFNKRTVENPYPENNWAKEQNETKGRYSSYTGKDEEERKTILKKYPLLWNEQMSKHLIDGNAVLFQNVQIMRDSENKLLEQPSAPYDQIYAASRLWCPKDDYEENYELYRKLIENILFNEFYEFKGKKVLILSDIGLNYFIAKNIRGATKEESNAKVNEIRNKCIDVIDEIVKKETKTAYDKVILVNISKK